MERQDDLQYEFNFEPYIFCLWVKENHPDFFQTLEELYLKSQK